MQASNSSLREQHRLLDGLVANREEVLSRIWQRTVGALPEYRSLSPAGMAEMEAASRKAFDTMVACLRAGRMAHSRSELAPLEDIGAAASRNGLTLEALNASFNIMVDEIDREMAVVSMSRNKAGRPGARGRPTR